MCSIETLIIALVLGLSRNNQSVSPLTILTSIGATLPTELITRTEDKRGRYGEILLGVYYA